MVFTGTDAGTSFGVTSDLKTADAIPVAIPFTTSVAQTAQQAEAYIDGIKVVSDSNTLSGTISGVTINLNAVSEVDPSGTPIAPDTQAYKTSLLEIKPDTGALKEKLTTFVTSYNKVMEWILSGYPEFTGSAATATDPATPDLLGSVLRGDSSINSVKRGLQSVLGSVTKTSGSLSILSQLGITTKLDGTLDQDNTKMDAALQDNFDGVSTLLSGEGSVDGVMKKMNYFLLDVTSGSTGLYAGKKKSYDLKLRELMTRFEIWNHGWPKKRPHSGPNIQRWNNSSAV